MVGLTLGGTLSIALAQTKKPAAPAKPTAAQIAAGAKVYDASGCGGCHMINGKGGAAGPDLSTTGADPKHTAKWMEVQVVTPKVHKADSAMPAGDTIKGKDLTNLSAYLTSLKKAAPAKPDSPKPSSP